MLGELETTTGRLVVADLEAGVGTVSRLAGGAIDRLLLVVEPGAKSLDVARRARDIAAQVGIADVVVVANRVSSDEDVERIRQALSGLHVHVVPEDAAIRDADRAGEAPLDASPDASAVRALAELAERLTG